MPRQKLEPHRRIPLPPPRDSPKQWTLGTADSMFRTHSPQVWAQEAMRVAQVPSSIALLKIANALHLVYLDGREIKQAVFRLQPQRIIVEDLDDRGITVEKILMREVESEAGMVGILPDEFVKVEMKHQLVFPDGRDSVGYSSKFAVYFSGEPSDYDKEFNKAIPEKNGMQQNYTVTDLTLIEH